MSKVVSWLVIGMLASGCTAKRARYAAAGASAVAGAIAIVAAGPAEDCRTPPPPEMDPLGLQNLGAGLCEMNNDIRNAWIITGVAMIVAGIVGVALTAQTEPHQVERPAPPPRIADAGSIREPRTGDPVLRQLTAQAAMAARAGHCTAVRILADRIAKIDLDYRTTVFVDDSAIATCLR